MVLVCLLYTQRELVMEESDKKSWDAKADERVDSSPASTVFQHALAQACSDFCMNETQKQEFAAYQQLMAMRQAEHSIAVTKFLTDASLGLGGGYAAHRIWSTEWTDFGKGVVTTAVGLFGYWLRGRVMKALQ